MAPEAEARWPSCTTSSTGSSGTPKVAIELTTTRPSPPAGAMKASPQGRFPNAPRSRRSPSSEIATRPLSSRRRSVPSGHVTWACRASVRRSATARLRRAISSKSLPIRRASMSAVTPGIVAPRAPRSVAALRAVVCDSDGRHGAMNTSQAASAAATVAAARSRAPASGGDDDERCVGAGLEGAVQERAAEIDPCPGRRSPALARRCARRGSGRSRSGRRCVELDRSRERSPRKARSRRSTSSSVVCRCGAIRSEAPRTAA